MQNASLQQQLATGVVCPGDQLDEALAREEERSRYAGDRMEHKMTSEGWRERKPLLQVAGFGELGIIRRRLCIWMDAVCRLQWDCPRIERCSPFNAIHLP
jgi:hypothetical protein